MRSYIARPIHRCHNTQDTFSHALPSPPRQAMTLHMHIPGCLCRVQAVESDRVAEERFVAKEVFAPFNPACGRPVCLRVHFVHAMHMQAVKRHEALKNKKKRAHKSAPSGVYSVENIAGHLGVEYNKVRKSFRLAPKRPNRGKRKRDAPASDDESE
jgi:hypothetical protein